MEVLPTSMVFVQKPVSALQMKELNLPQPWKHKSRLVILGNLQHFFASETHTHNLDPSVFRLFLSLTAGSGNCLASTDISNAFLNAELDERRMVVLSPPAMLIKMGILPPGTYWLAAKAV